MSDLRQRVPGHSLIDELLHQWDIGAIHPGAKADEIVIGDEAVSWYRGVIGERRVASLLAQLGPEWTVLHSVPVGRGSTDIDHIVLGPPGVFTINTKYSPGRDVWVAGFGLYVAGHKQHYVANSVREAHRASQLLTGACGTAVPVTAIIVFVDPARVTHKAAAGSNVIEIKVVSDQQLLAALQGEAMLMPHEVARAVDAAVRPETWHQQPTPSTIGNHIEPEFAALEAAVGPRLAAPVVRTRTPARKSTTRPTRTYPSRPARSSSRRGRTKRSPLEKLIQSLVGPIAGFALLWVLIQYLANR